ncbi:UNVERIFIED_CONTAM: hypothetical protein HDU68_006578 [Siphonaria sp. JEL0065]|nr:hypothetical protein HDU68_006578 [Siphonaria sp. JEL0065]
MKKLVDSAKGGGLKSGNLKKAGQGASTAILAATAAAASGQSDEPADAPVIIFPEWSDAEVAAEKWTTKHAFEDPEGLAPLPRSLRSLLPAKANEPGYVQKRHVDILGDGSTPIGVASPALVEDAFCAIPVIAPAPPAANNLGVHMSVASRVKSTADESQEVAPTESLTQPEGATGSESEHLATTAATSNGSNPNITQPTPDLMLSGIDNQGTALSSVNLEEDINATAAAQSSEQENLAATSKFFQQNRHIVGSELIRQIVATLHLLYDQSKTSRANNLTDEFSPWENLYPKGKDGLPMYNPSGRYAVKLFWLGCWRKVIVDDRIPVDDQNRPLLVCSPTPQEIWPLLLTKALLKIASASYKDNDLGTSGLSVNGEAVRPFEHGDFDVLHALKGWVPERISVGDREERMNRLWVSLNDLNLKIPMNFPPAPKNVIWGAPIAPVAAAPAVPAKGGAAAAAAAAAAAPPPPPVSSNVVGERLNSPGGGKSGPYAIVLALRHGDVGDVRFVGVN